MAASGYTPIQLYHSTTASAVPVNTNLVNGELAINIADGKLYYKDSGGTVQVIATKGSGTIGGSNTQVQYNSSGSLAGSANFTFNGTTATINTLNLTNALGATYGGTAQSTYAQGDMIYASAANTLAKLTIGTNNQVLTSNGTDPVWVSGLNITTLTATQDVTFSATSQNIALGTSQTSGLLTVGGASQTGAIVIGQSTKTQSLSIANGAVESGLTKTINIGTNGDSGSTTNINIGSGSGTITTNFSGTVNVVTANIVGAVTMSATTQNINLGTSQTTGTFTVGGASQTGALTLDQSTKTHTLNLGTGATESGLTKTINLGTAGVSGSTTAITVGSANGTTTTLNGTVTAATLNSTTIDTTNIEVTNIKAKDGTAALSIADSTGVVSVSANPVLSGGTANGVLYLNASKVATSGSGLTYDGTTLVSANGSVQVPSTATFKFGAGFTNYIQGDTSSNYLLFATNSTEKLRITSGGQVNIGGNFTSTNNTLQVTGNAAIGYTTAAPTTGLIVAGNVGIGTDAPGERLVVSNAAGSVAAQILASTTGTSNLYFADGTTGADNYTGFIQYNHSTNAMSFGTNGGNERARITSGGYFKASNDGTYFNATGTYHELRQSANVDTVFITNTNASPTNMSVIISRYTAASPNNTSTYFLYCSDGGSTVRANIRTNGGLANYQSNNVDLSDIRTKTDINPLASYWNKIAALEIVTYKYKDQTHDDLNIGVIAQQVEQVAPEFVDPDGFGETPEDGVPLKTIYNKDLTFAAIKALQEAMARIEKLEAEVAALKEV